MTCRPNVVNLWSLPNDDITTCACPESSHSGSLMGRARHTSLITVSLSVWVSKVVIVEERPQFDVNILITFNDLFYVYKRHPNSGRNNDLHTSWLALYQWPCIHGNFSTAQPYRREEINVETRFCQEYKCSKTGIRNLNVIVFDFNLAPLLSDCRTPS